MTPCTELFYIFSENSAGPVYDAPIRDSSAGKTGAYVSIRDKKRNRLLLAESDSHVQYTLILSADNTYVYSTHLAAVLGISLNVEGNLLLLVEGLVAVNQNRGEMYEYVISALIRRDKSISLLRVEPLNSTSLHENTSLLILPLSVFIKKSHV